MPAKRLLMLMRHAKSSWKDDALSDEERPLNKRGMEAAEFMGTYLRDHGLAPDAIVASSAVRAQETARRVNKSGGFGIEIQTAQEIYLSGAPSYVRVIGGVGPAVYRLLVIGHNPDLEVLVARLTGNEESMPTGAVACMEVSAADWVAFARGPRATLQRVLRPKELRGDDADE